MPILSRGHVNINIKLYSIPFYSIFEKNDEHDPNK